jgi:Trk K+ transport system NAD-binding subunit
VSGVNRQCELLVVTFSEAGVDYVRRAQQLGARVRVLDCFEAYHRQLLKTYGPQMLLQTQGHRADVRQTVARERFDAAIVHADGDLVRTALVTQSLCEAGVGEILVVTDTPSHRKLYRRLGAHRVIVATNVDAAWAQLYRYLPKYMPA